MKEIDGFDLMVWRIKNEDNMKYREIITPIETYADKVQDRLKVGEYIDRTNKSSSNITG